MPVQQNRRGVRAPTRPGRLPLLRLPDAGHTDLPGRPGRPDRPKVRTDPDTPYATVLTTEHRALLPRLDPAEYRVEEIREFTESYDDELSDDELQEAVTDTLGLLRTTIADLADDEVFVILIS
ncbi:hypothetical protein ABZS66_60085 [Dactylosporangium sp. NPDC005572]|uniref:hypothetical protein n=1 Tax=Dactylosporangium sp. NPDC005572 TaxID=3156889 RepID=UPI0033A56BD8